MIGLRLFDEDVIDQWLKRFRESLLSTMLQFPISQVLMQSGDFYLELLLFLFEKRFDIEAFLADDIQDGIETQAYCFNAVLDKLVLFFKQLEVFVVLCFTFFRRALG